MRRVTYHGPTHRLRLPSGRTIDRGETAEVTNADADTAAAATNIHVTVADGDEPEAEGEGHDTDTKEA